MISKFVSYMLAKMFEYVFPRQAMHTLSSGCSSQLGVKRDLTVSGSLRSQILQLLCL